MWASGMGVWVALCKPSLVHGTCCELSFQVWQPEPGGAAAVFILQVRKLRHNW